VELTGRAVEAVDVNPCDSGLLDLVASFGRESLDRPAPSRDEVSSDIALDQPHRRLRSVHAVALDTANEWIDSLDDEVPVVGYGLADNADIPEVEGFDKGLYSVE